MKKIFTAVFTILLITGCAVNNQSGNYTTTTEDLQQSLAKDAANIIYEEYPPAATSLKTDQNITDFFGLELINNLRQAGFAVGDLESQSNGLLLRYYLTNLADDYYRLTLKVDEKTYNRAYYGGVGVSAWTKGD